MADRDGQLRSPVAIVGTVVRFNDGTEMEVWDLARRWASYDHALHGAACMVPHCNQRATSNIALWSHHVGRVCDEHFLITTEILVHGQECNGG